MIWVIGGTSEGKEISKIYENHPEIIFTIATEEGREFLHTDNVWVGRLDKDEMKEFIHQYEIELLIDSSHPFADIVTKMAKEAAEEENIPYIRYIRPENDRYENILYVDSYQEAYKKISQLKGNFLFTTGSKFVKNFQEVKGDNRFIFRVLPTENSMRDLKAAGVEMKDSLGMLGPFSMEMNRLQLREYHIDYLVSKESGKSGGFDEKVRACELEGVIPIVIRRKDEEGIKDINEIRARIDEVLNGR